MKNKQAKRKKKQVEKSSKEFIRGQTINGQNDGSYRQSFLNIQTWFSDVTD